MKFYHFGPEIDGEKWCRKSVLEIPSCGSHFLLIHLFQRNEAFSTKFTNSLTKTSTYDIETIAQNLQLG